MPRPHILLSTALALVGLLAARPAQAQPAGRHPVLMISIDGLAPDAAIEADKHGLKIPVLRSFLAQGSYAREVLNVNPTVTNPNHTTLVTGVLPAEHGVYNNRPFDASGKLPKSYSLYSDIKAPTLWAAAKAAGLKTGSVFWPVTAKAGDIDFNLAEGESDDDAKLQADTIALIEQHRPELLTVHIVSLDHDEHTFGPFTPEAKARLEKIDAVVGAIVGAERKAHPDSVVAIVSDHGFYKVSHQVNLNAGLAQAGFITLGDNPDKPVASWRAFAWYVGGSAMMVLQDPGDQATKSRLNAYLQTLANDPLSGVERIYARGEIAGQGYAPEVEFVVALKAGYLMGNLLTGPVVADAKGGHHGAYSTTSLRPEMHSSFFITGPGIAAGKNLGLIDMRRIAPTLAELLKVSLPSAKMRPLSLSLQ